MSARLSMARSPSLALHGADRGPHRSIGLPVAVFSVSALVAALVLSTPGNPGDSLGRVVLQLCVIGVPVATGSYALRNPHTQRFGALLIAIGLIWSLAVLSESDSSLLYSTGRVIGWGIVPLVVYTMLAFPDGRIRERRDRILFRSIVGVVVLLFVGSALFVNGYPVHSPWASCTKACPANAFQIVGREPGWVNTVLAPLRDALSLALLFVVTLSLLGRRRAMTALQRATMDPVVVLSVAATLILMSFIATRRAGVSGNYVDAFAVAWALCLPALAGAFWVGLLRRRLYIGRVLAQLTIDLNRATSVRGVARALRAVLGEGEVDVLLPVGDGWGHADVRVADARDPDGQGATVREVADDAGPVARLVFAGDIGNDDELLDSVSSLSASVLRKLAVDVELEDSLREIEASRHRIATAASVERQRIERDLHDGAQQRLIALRMRLALAEETSRTDPDGVREILRRLGDDVDGALEEIRSLARGLYPAVLSDRGLAEALRAVAKQAGRPVDVEARDIGRHPPEVEAAVYFACLEALQNVSKHARESKSVRVRVRKTDALRFEVADDGPGFDPLTHPAGAGLRNMKDRVEALGGRVIVTGGTGGGTVVRGMIPLQRD